MSGSDKRNQTTASSRKRRKKWRCVFHENRLAAYCEQDDDGRWRVFVNRLEVGVVENFDAARELIGRLKKGGRDV
jgi:hypothetical protein